MSRRSETWTRVAPGAYDRGPWRIYRREHPRFPGRPWVLDHRRTTNDGAWDRAGRYHTLVLAKRAADLGDDVAVNLAPQETP